MVCKRGIQFFIVLQYSRSVSHVKYRVDFFFVLPSCPVPAVYRGVKFRRITRRGQVTFIGVSRAPPVLNTTGAIINNYIVYCAWTFASKLLFAGIYSFFRFLEVVKTTYPCRFLLRIRTRYSVVLENTCTCANFFPVGVVK